MCIGGVLVFAKYMYSESLYVPLFTRSKKLGSILFLALLVSPGYAHEVRVSEDVGATLHIQPNDNPHAGEPGLAWFALTRKGGQTIPLSQCNCKLAVYSKPRSPALLKPALKAVSYQRYQAIPGANIAFPKVGNYQLELSGTPKAGASFKPFKLTYTVAVPR